MINTEYQEALFKLISNYLKKDIHCIAIGGTAMMIKNYQNTTKDIDLVFKNEKDRESFISAIKELGYKEGVDFKEQVPIDIYTVDVLFPKKNIIIEWDGNFWHNQPERVKHDKERDKFLSQLGFNIIHITSEEIKDTEDTKNKINEELSI